MDKKTPGEIINELPVGGFAKLSKVQHAGSLEARKLSSGVALYWRYTLAGKTERVLIGNYHAKAPPKATEPTARGYSVEAARLAAQDLAKAHKENLAHGGHRGLLEAEAEAERLKAEAQADAIRKAEAIKTEAAKYNLTKLLDAYCDHIERLGRRSHKDARSIFRIHVNEAWPEIAATPANQVTGEQVADMMRKTLESGKGRTANKLRSYIRAAYQTALLARSKASIPVQFKEYRITHNPAAETAPDENQNNPDKNPLSAQELRDYWQIIKPMPGFKGAVLRLHLLTGGLRIEQLVALKTSNVTGNAITLYDGKGRPGKAPRPHSVPLLADAARALAECKPEGVYAISTDGGKTHLAATSLSRWAVVAAESIPGFATKRIRSGVETLLASARISTDIRGRLQSHGISGVQARHYDGYDYMDEKRQALETLFRLLNEPETDNVLLFPIANHAT